MSKQQTAFLEINSNGLKVFYRKFGSGPPLILFHGGWATSYLNWSGHFKELGKRFTVYAVDHRGHGRTTNPDSKFTSYGQLAWDMIEFIKELNLPQKPIVMGHSSGALISLHISIFEPDLITRQVLISIHPFIAVSDHWRRGIEKFFHTSDYRVPPKKWHYIFKRPSNAIALWWSHRTTPWYTLLHQAWPMWTTPFDLEKSDYSKISCPTLVLIGTRDEFGTVEEANELGRRIKNSSVMVVPDADHMFVMTHPKRLQKRVMPFLSHGPTTQDNTPLPKTSLD